MLCSSRRNHSEPQICSIGEPMSIIFSRECEYALQAVMYLALKPENESTSIKELAETLHIPFHFLGKILQRLVRKGLLRSLKGPTGGFRLALPPERITLLQVIEAIDGPGLQKSCILGFPECSSSSPCALHNEWAASRDAINAMLTSRSISEMAHSTKKSQYLTVKRR